MKQNIKIKKDFSVVILAAGKSERLGFPKLSLMYDEKTTFIEKIVNDYQKFKCQEIIIVVNDEGNKVLIERGIKFPKNSKIVINKHPDWHRFYSLKVGVKSLSYISSIFIHNVDNPFVNHQVLNSLLGNNVKADYLNPVYDNKGGHPILISDKIGNEIESSDENQLHLKEFLNQFKRLKVPVIDKNILVNIDTKEEYTKYFSYQV